MAHSHSHGPTADVSVRPATLDDVAIIAGIQLESLREVLTGAGKSGSANSQDETLPLNQSQVETSWHQAIATPPSAKHRMLCACQGVSVVGFAALAPAPRSKEIGEVVALEVAADHRRAGHGSRLLAACTDILKATGATHVRAWALEADSARAAFYGGSGLAPLGVRRELDVAGQRLAEIAFGAMFE